MAASTAQHPTTVSADDRLEAAAVRVCERLGDFIEWWGFKSIHGRVWAFLAIRGEPCAQAEIVRALGVSRALVSGSVQELEAFGLVSRLGEGRRAPWIANMDVWPVITRILREREWLMIEEVRLALEAAVEEIAVHEREHGLGSTPWSASRLRALYALTEFAQNFLKIILSLRNPGERAGIRRTLKSAARTFRALRQT